jgi:hypothetical protein
MGFGIMRDIARKPLPKRDERQRQPRQADQLREWHRGRDNRPRSLLSMAQESPQPEPRMPPGARRW